MAETETAAQAGELLPSTWNTSEALRLDGDAVDKLAQLGAQATGAAVIEVETPSTAEGLPSRFRVGVLHGEKPSFVSVKQFAEEWRRHPEHRRGVAIVGDVRSFIDLVNRHKTEDSVAFANSDWQTPSLTAVIDYHCHDALGFADFGRHRVRYDFPFSDEWKVWAKHDGKAMDQAEFAEFVEERAPDMTTLVEAEAAHFAREMQVARVGMPMEIFELARDLEINVGGKVKQNLKLQSGEAKISFVEEHTGRDGAPITVPGAFALRIPMFKNGEPIDIPVRLRYRVVGGAVVWIYKLFRVDRLVNESVRVAKQDVENDTALPVYEGAPEMTADGRIVTGSGGA